MKKFFFFAAAALVSVAMSAQTIEVCALDSAKLAELNGAGVATKTYTEAAIAAGAVFMDGTNMKVSNPFEQTMQWVGAAQPNGAHKRVQIGNQEISMVEGLQGHDNPKDVDGGNPCNTLLVPTQNACFQVEPKVDGYVVVLHKGSSNKQYFVFENGSPLGYQLGMMTYADNTLGANGLLQYELVGDETYNYLTAENLEASTGFNKIAMVEDYFNDTLTSGIAWENYKQNGVCAVVFEAFANCTYLVGGAGTKMTAAAIVFVKDIAADLNITAVGETITEEGKDPVTYDNVVLATIKAPTAIKNVAADAKAVKFIENGRVIILKNGVKYTVLGTVAE